MNEDRLKQLRNGWAKRRGSRTVLALLDAIEAADRMRNELPIEWSDCLCYARGGECSTCTAVKLYDAAKARI